MTNDIKRKDLGIGGAFIVLAQALASFHSSQNLSGEIESLRDEIENSRIHTEQFFVRKTELQAFSDKIEKVNDRLVQINDKVISLRTLLNKRADIEAAFYCRQAVLYEAKK